MSFRVIGNRVVVRPYAPEERPLIEVYGPFAERGGTADAGMVIAVSDQVKRCPIEVGMTAWYPREKGHQVSFDGVHALILDVGDLCGAS